MKGFFSVQCSVAVGSLFGCRLSVEVDCGEVSGLKFQVEVDYGSGLFNFLNFFNLCCFFEHGLNRFNGLTQVFLNWIWFLKLKLTFQLILFFEVDIAILYAKTYPQTCHPVRVSCTNEVWWWIVESCCRLYVEVDWGKLLSVVCCLLKWITWVPSLGRDDKFGG